MTQTKDRAFEMKTAALLIAALSLCFFSGCVAPVVGPTVQILNPSKKSMELFTRDAAACMQYANQRLTVGEHDVFPDEIGAAVLHVAVTPRMAPVQITRQQHYDLAYAQCMIERGNILPGYVPPAAPKSQRVRHPRPPGSPPGKPSEPEFVEPPPSDR